MNLTMLMKFGDGIEKAAMGDKAMFGLQVIGIGMGVIFGVLILLIGVLQLFKLFTIKKTLDEKSPATTETTSVSTTSATVATVTTVPSSEEEKMVAIATAAIAASRGESECAFNVISIKKIVK